MNLSRSPYIITIDETGQTGSKIELFLWNTGTIPPDPAYTLSKLIPASNNTATHYNISPYIQEYYNFTKWQEGTAIAFDANISANYVVQYAVKRYENVNGTYNLLNTVTGEFANGYSSYMQGMNQTNNIVLLDEGTYFYHYDSDIPSQQSNALAGSFDAQMEVGETMKYTNLSTGSTQLYQTTVAGTKSYGRVNFNQEAYGSKVEKINTSSEVVWTSYFKPVCEPKYSPVVIDFVNKYGSWSRIFFLKVKKRKINIKSDSYKLNPATLPYDQTHGGQINEFNKTGSQSIKLNTGWVNDGYAEYLQQLLLSEKITLLDYEVDTQYTPVNVQTKSLEKQTGLNNGMMNYELTFNFAFDLINNVV
tara:strand:- start:1195 stop:2280 length:1086 start_codon:yes stop_codon:yes gene_type:complete